MSFIAIKLLINWFSSFFALIQINTPSLLDKYLAVNFYLSLISFNKASIETLESIKVKLVVLIRQSSSG